MPLQGLKKAREKVKRAIRAASNSGETNYYKIAALKDARAVLADIAYHQDKKRQHRAGQVGGPKGPELVEFNATDGDDDVARKILTLLQKHCLQQPDPEEDD